MNTTNSIRRTSIIIDPDTKKPVTKTIITKKGNKKVIIVKDYNLMLPFKKQVKEKYVKPISVGYISPFPLNKEIPTTKMDKKQDIWSEFGKQIRDDYRLIKKHLDAEVTETFTHPNYDKSDPNKLGYYTVTRKVKREFRQLPSMKLTANERIEAMKAHKANKALAKVDKIAQKVDTSTLVGKILPAFDKEFYTAKFKERHSTPSEAKRKDGYTMSFRDITKNVISTKKFTVIESIERTFNNGKKYDSPSQTVVVNSFDEAVEIQNGWYDRAIAHKSKDIRRIIITEAVDAATNRPPKEILSEKLYTPQLAS